MNESDILQISHDAVVVMLKIGAPMMIAALAVGLVISLLQALTQVQEMTLVFVPKIVVIFVVFMLSLPFMLATLSNFTQDLTQRIIGAG